MSNASTVTVQQAIVHITDRNMPAPVCSDFELGLGASPELHAYFTAQVENALDEEQTGAALFAETPPHDAKNECDRILAGPADFIDASQALARLLHAAMRTHARIAPGSLAVCAYTVAKDPARNVALIKLDPATGFVQEVVPQKNNKQLIRFDVVDNVMPTARERLHKAALVSPRGKHKYDLQLLDRQTPEVAAAWWAETFLNTVPVYDGKRGAEEFKKGIDAAYRVLVKENLITLAEGETLHQHADVAMQAKTVNRRNFVGNLPFDEPVKERVRTVLEKRFPGANTIPINPKYAAENVVNKTRYHGDYGVVLEYETAHEHHVVIERKDFERDGTPVTRLLLEIPRLQRVK